MHRYPERVLESVVALTRQRDQESLELSVATTVLELTAIEELSLFRVLRPGYYDEVEKTVHVAKEAGGGIAVFYSDGEQPAVDKTPAPVLEVVRDGQPLEYADEAGNKLVLPVVCNNAVIGAFSLSASEFSQTDRRFVEGFVAIYRNYLEILNDSERDTLTGLLNRKTFDKKLLRLLNESAHCERFHKVPPHVRVERRDVTGEKSNWLGVMDIDHFKRINDNFGHVFGDEVLLLFAQIVTKCFRGYDLIFRFGGEEFVVILTSCVREDAAAAFERCRKKIAEFNFPGVGRVTASVGYTELSRSSNPAIVLERADRALYFAKQNGRDQVASYETLVENHKIEAFSPVSQVELF